MRARLSKPQVLKLKMIPKTYSLLSITFEIRCSVVDGSVEDLSVGQWLVVRSNNLWKLAIGKLKRCKIASCSNARSPETCCSTGT